MEYFKLDVSPRIIPSPRAAPYCGRLFAQLDAVLTVFCMRRSSHVIPFWWWADGVWKGL